MAAGFAKAAPIAVGPGITLRAICGFSGSAANRSLFLQLGTWFPPAEFPESSPSAVWITVPNPEKLSSP